MSPQSTPKPVAQATDFFFWGGGKYMVPPSIQTLVNEETGSNWFSGWGPSPDQAGLLNETLQKSRQGRQKV